MKKDIMKISGKCLKKNHLKCVNPFLERQILYAFTYVDILS